MAAFTISPPSKLHRNDTAGFVRVGPARHSSSSEFSSAATPVQSAGASKNSAVLGNEVHPNPLSMVTEFELHTRSNSCNSAL
jgi:hypothetical protein